MNVGINTVLAILFIGVVVGFISGLRAGSVNNRSDGTILLDTRNESNISYHVSFDNDPKNYLQKDKLTFKVKTR